MVTPQSKSRINLSRLHAITTSQSCSNLSARSKIQRSTCRKNRLYLLLHSDHLQNYEQQKDLRTVQVVRGSLLKVIAWRLKLPVVQSPWAEVVSAIKNNPYTVTSSVRVWGHNIFRAFCERRGLPLSVLPITFGFIMQGRNVFQSLFYYDFSKYPDN